MIRIQPHYRSRAGFTMLELVVVVSILVILSASMISGFASMERTQRLNNATDKVISMFYKARSLAISNNAIYHVRLQDGDWTNVNTATGRPVDDSYYLMLYKYTSTSEALSVHTAADMGPGRNAAFSLGMPPEEHYQQLMNQAALNPDPTEADILRAKADQVCKNPNRLDADGFQTFYNNYRVDQIKLDIGTAMGIQAPIGSSQPPSDDVIFFYPDGTASKSVTIFVTDLINNSPPRSATNDFRDDRLTADLYVDRNNARAAAHAAQSPNIHMIQVLRGGMIKMLKMAETLP